MFEKLLRGSFFDNFTFVDKEPPIPIVTSINNVKKNAVLTLCIILL